MSSLHITDPVQPDRSDHVSVVRPGLPVPVAVHAPDPISREGALSQLRRHPHIELREEHGPGTVALLVHDELDRGGLTCLRRAVRGQGSRAVLVVGTLREEEFHDVVACGVGAVVWRREATQHSLVEAVLATARGDGHLPADLLGRLIRTMGAPPPRTTGGRRTGGPAAALGAREVDVLRLIAEGLGTAEIAAALSYSERTVKNVIHRLTTRLNLRNRAHAVAYALRQGYI